ncbi:protein kinase domain-containing protein [Marinobacter sp.]|uniref:protein kinase domain-containing protein n=1 Tax=Marinobacter sp. TaxID=50741 RepID=UPI003568E78C
MSAVLNFLEARGSLNEGDATFIHPSGRQAILLDGVSGANPGRARQLCLNWLEANAGEHPTAPAAIFEGLHERLAASDCQAVGAVVTRTGQRFQVDYVGNIRLYAFSDNQPVRLLLDEALSQPEQTLGQPRVPVPETRLVDLQPDTNFLLTSDGIDHQKVTESGLNASDFRGASLYQQLAPMARENDWSALLFPVAEQAELVRKEWPYNPFEGVQEERYHERTGLQAIADALFAERTMAGFRIIPSPAITSKNSSRCLDGLLVCPLGIFPLELKDYYGDITLHLGKDQRESLVISHNGKQQKTTNPVVKVREAIRPFSMIPALQSIQEVRARRMGIVVFTHPAGKVTCLGMDNTPCPLPWQDGEVLICQPASIAQGIKAYAREYTGKKFRPQLSEADIDQICRGLLNVDSAPARNPVGGGFNVDYEHPLVSESSPYYTVYPATLDGDELWAKEFRLSSLSGVSRAEELSRIGREARVLHRLSRRRIPGIPYFYETRSAPDSLLVFVEPGAPLTLETWIVGNPTRKARLKLLDALAGMLAAIAELRPAVVHRAITPRNIRVQKDGSPQLINFELCQTDTLATLLVDARQTFNQSYQAPEVNQAGKRLTPATDVYSFMLCVYFAMTGRHLIGQEARAFKAQKIRPGFYRNLVSDMGLPAQAAPLWQKALHDTAAERPNFAEIRQELHRWSTL